MKLSKYVSFLKYSDLVASIIVGLFIIYTAINIIRENYSIIIGEQETDIDYLNKIKREIKSIPQVLSIKSLVIMKYGHKSSLNLIIGMDGNITIKYTGTNIQVVSATEADYPLQKKRHSPEYLREIAYLRPRANTYQAVFRVRSVAAMAIHTYFQEI